MSLFLIDFENVHDSGISGITQLTAEDEVCIFYSQKSEHMSFDTHVNIMKSEAKIQYIKLRKSAKNYLDFQLVTHLGYLVGAGFEGPYFVISKDTGFDSVVDYWKDHGVTVTRQPSIGFHLRQNRQNFQQQYQNNQNIRPLPAAEIETETEEAEFMTIPETAEESDDVVITEVDEDEVQESIVTDTFTDSVEESSDVVSESVPETDDKDLVLIKPDALPESFRKKVRAALKGKNIPSGNYSAIYKAIVNSYDKLALNNLMVKSFGSSKGGLVYNAIRDIFTEYHSL